MMPLRIGTRGSGLALWQARYVQEMLRPLLADRPIELVEIQTQGDEITEVRLSELGGDGAFTKRIQLALVDHQVDVAVHSLKDLPTIPFEGLILASVPPRGLTGDALISVKHSGFDSLPKGATIATSSLRRQAQLLHRRPDLQIIENFRGNVDTRIRKLKEEGYDGIILAEAGLMRLGFQEEITEVLDSSWMLPAVGQGALGLECRTDDEETRSLLAKINDSRTYQAVIAERSFLYRLAAGCQAPIGAHAVVCDSSLTLKAAILSVDGQERLERQITGAPTEAEALGIALAEELIHDGADRLLPDDLQR